MSSASNPLPPESRITAISVCQLSVLLASLAAFAGSDVKVAELVARLGDPDWTRRQAATSQLVAAGSQAVPELRRAMRSPDAEVRYRALYILGRIRATVAPEDDAQARRAFEQCLRFAAEHPEKADEVQRQFRQVAQRYAGTKWAEAAEERAAGKEPPDTARRPQAVAGPPVEVPGLIAALESPDWAVRKGATDELIRAGEGSVAALADIKTTDPEVLWRVEMIRNQIARKSAAVPKPMLSELDPEPDDFLALSPGPAAALISRLRRFDTREARAARRELVELGDQAIPALLRALDSENDLVKIEIMDILREITGQELGFRPERWKKWWHSH